MPSFPKHSADGSNEGFYFVL